MTRQTKTVLIGLSIFAAIVAGVFVVYTLRQPTVAPKPSAKPAVRIPSPSPESVNINVVTPQADKCTLEFTVTATSSASPSPSGSASPSPSASPSVPASASPSPSSDASAQLDCIVKRVYKDAANNTAGQYYLNEEIVDTNVLQNGQTIIYNVLVGNKGSAPVSDTTITDVLSSNLTYVDGESGCSYNSGTRTVTCTIGSLAGNTEASRSIRVKISTAGTSAIANTADVFSTNGQRDSCSITVNATGQIVQPPSPAPTALPEAGVFEVTTGTLGVGLLLLLVGALGLLLI